MKSMLNFYTFLLFFVSSYSYGQMEQYNYKRELTGISGQWHSIVLPNEMFSNISPNLSDIRIFGITSNQDTIESPYLFKIEEDQITNKEVVFNKLNSSSNKNGYFVTFEVPSNETINQIDLNLKEQNFDWRIDLEGSHNQQEWFSVLENYRILSIKNNETDFNFTNLSFQNSNYRFYRLRFNSKVEPKLTSASIVQNTTLNGIYNDFPIRKLTTTENKELKRTEIDVELKSAVPVSQINLAMTDAIDYYRAVSIKYLVDSVETDKGWNHQYRTLTSGTLVSFKENTFNFRTTTLQKFRILIHNQDNQALTLDSIDVAGYVHKVIVRFSEPASYFIAYGKENARKPNYDIAEFTDKIPESLTTLKIGKEESIDKSIITESDALFKNKNWLWLIMVVMILLLGGFTVGMMRKA